MEAKAHKSSLHEAYQACTAVQLATPGNLELCAGPIKGST